MSGPLDFDPPTAREEPLPPPPVRPTGPPPPARPPGASRYGWFVGVVVVLILAYILLNTLRTEHLRQTGPEPGSVAPAFAAPLVLSKLDGAANIARAGDHPACTVRGPMILNLCELGERGPIVLAFFATRGAKCTEPLDVMERLRLRFPGVGFAAVSIGGSRDAPAKLIRKHGWRFPVGWDPTGAVTNIYGVAVCPEVIFTYPGRVVKQTVIGKAVTAGFERRVRALVAASRRRGWRPPA